MFRKRASQLKDCNCQTSLSPLYQTVTTRSDSPETAYAMITMRGSILIESSAGLQRLVPAAHYELSFDAIAEILRSDSSILYFERNTDQALFLMVFPEFVGKI